MKGADLKVTELKAWYGESQVLSGISFAAPAGQLVSLLGRNGAGKSTTFRAIMGLMDRAEGRITVGDHSLLGRAPHRIARLGLGYCPEERGIFGQLTVAENLTLPPKSGESEFDQARIFDLFPHLKNRLTTRAARLSGGEQQMLAIARILMNGSRVLLLDEPTEGLAPVIIDLIEDVITALKASGLTIVLIEQNIDFALAVADRHFVLEAGEIVAEYDAASARVERDSISKLLGV